MALWSMASVINAQTFTNSSAMTIPNSGASSGPAFPYPSPITVSGEAQLASISVTLLNFSHFYPHVT
jgi:hypothetical protein